jgi:hypothetical protein
MNSSEKKLEYHIERLSDENIADVEKLHKAVYGKTPRRNFFQKKYKTLFTGIQHVGFLAYSNDNLAIAFYAVIPCFIRIDNKIILSAQSADTMTHPQYRNKGLFVELALLTYQLCDNSGIELIFGFPNQNSLPGFLNKLGWKMTEQMDCFVIPISKYSWGGFLSRFPILKNWIAAYRKRILKKHLLMQKGVDNSVFNDGFGGVYRNYNYLKYKTYSDTGAIQIGDSTLWVKTDGILLIGDISVVATDFDNMIHKLKKLASRLSIKEIHFHASPGTTLHKLFTDCFESIPSFPVIFKDLVRKIPLSKIKFTSADIDTF